MLWKAGLRSIEGHLILYGVLAWLALATIQSCNKTAVRSLRWVLISAAFAALYGMSDEYRQSLVPGRTASAVDVLWDGLGAVLAAASLGYIAATWDRVRRRY